MALITLPSSPARGVVQNYSLNLTDLFALVTDSYYTSQDNISKIIVLYASSTGNQLENITFFPNGVSTTISTSAMFAAQAFDTFEVAFIAIIDKQNGRYVVPAASIPSVINYMILFLGSDANGLNYFSNEGSPYPLNMGIDSNDNIYSAIGYYGMNVGGKISTSILTDLATNSIDNDTSDLINDVSTMNVCFNASMTKAYLVGAYNGVFGTQSFLAPSNPSSLQVIEMNLADGIVTLLITLDNFFSSAIGFSHYTGKILVNTAGRIGLIDISTQSLVWQKTISTDTTPAWIAGSNFYLATSSYDGISLSFDKTCIKADILTGALDNSFPLTTERIGTIFDATADGKILVNRRDFSNSGTCGYYFNGTSWIDISGSVFGQTNYVNAMTVDPVSNKIFVSLVGYPFSSVNAVIQNDPTTGNYVGTVYTPPVINTGALYLRSRNNVTLMLLANASNQENPNFLKVNSSGATFVVDTSFVKIYATTFNNTIAIKEVAPDKIILQRVSGGGILMNYIPSFSPFKQWFSKYNSQTQVVEDAVDDLYLASSVSSQVRQPQSSSLLPDKMILVEENAIKECDTSVTPMTAGSNGWPQVTNLAQITDCLITGNYLYICANGLISLSDSGGGFSVNRMARINITTKLIDRTFTNGNTISFATNGGILSESDTYVYLVSSTAVVRVKKSDSSFEAYDSVPSFYISSGGSVRVGSAANGKLILMPFDNPFACFNNRPYNIVDESNFVADPVQPPIIHSGPNQGGGVSVMKMNPVDKLIYAVVAATSYYSWMGPYILVKYNPVTVTQVSVTYSGLGLISAPMSFTSSGTPYLLIYGSLNGKPVYGVRKINANLTFS